MTRSLTGYSGTPLAEKLGIRERTLQDARSWLACGDRCRGRARRVRVLAGADGDGFTVVDGDYDDNDAATYPGAPQLCDGVNHDCDDPDWPDVPDVQLDRDGDGFSACTGDCNDGHAGMGRDHPAREIQLARRTDSLARWRRRSTPRGR